MKVFIALILASNIFNDVFSLENEGLVIFFF